MFQRPQHLMTRFAAAMPVYFIEEVCFEETSQPYLAHFPGAENLTVLVPHLPPAMANANASRVQRKLLKQYFSPLGSAAPVLWFCTPAALEVAGELPASLIVYDCMDELSLFQGAPPALRRLEDELLNRADVVFTGGMSLFEAKCHRHHNVHAFPSAVDAGHFAKARDFRPDPPD